MPLLAAPPSARPDLPVVCPIFGFDPVPVLEHALHEKGLQGQIGVGPLVSSQERRALFVPLIKRWSSAGQLLILFLRQF